MVDVSLVPGSRPHSLEAILTSQDSPVDSKPSLLNDRQSVVQFVLGSSTYLRPNIRLLLSKGALSDEKTSVVYNWYRSLPEQSFSDSSETNSYFTKQSWNRSGLMASNSGVRLPHPTLKSWNVSSRKSYVWSWTPHGMCRILLSDTISTCQRPRKKSAPTALTTTASVHP
jgi:hypothetical protein